jgi:hypothetical protein
MRVVTITGASGGIGRAAAVEFARRGDLVALLAGGELALSGAAAVVEAVGGRTLIMPIDVSDLEQVCCSPRRKSGAGGLSISGEDHAKDRRGPGHRHDFADEVPRLMTRHQCLPRRRWMVADVALMDVCRA